MMNIDLGAQKLELLPLAEYSSRGFKGLVMQHLNCMGLHELQDNRVDLSAYEHVYVDNPSQGAEVLFSSNTSLASFEVLDLQSDSSRVIYSKGLLKPEEKLVLHLESFETDPELDYETVIKNGICFRDDTGSCASLRFGRRLWTAVFIWRRLIKVKSAFCAEIYRIRDFRR